MILLPGIPPYVYFLFNSAIRKSVLGIAIPSLASQPSTTMKLSNVISAWMTKANIRLKIADHKYSFFRIIRLQIIAWFTILFFIIPWNMKINLSVDDDVDTMSSS